MTFYKRQQTPQLLLPFPRRPPHLSVRQLIILLDAGAVCRGLQLFVKIQGDIAQLLLDVADDLTLGRGRKGIPALREQLHHVVCEVAPGHVDARDGMWHRETLIDWYDVCHAVARVDHHACRSPRAVEREDGLVFSFVSTMNIFGIREVKKGSLEWIHRKPVS